MPEREHAAERVADDRRLVEFERVYIFAVDWPWLHTGRQAGGRETSVAPRVGAPSSSASSVMATASYARDHAAAQELAIAIVLGTVVMLGSAVIAISWSLPMIAAWVHSGRVAHLGVLDALEALVNGRLYGGEPASAYRWRWRGCCRACGGSGAWPR